MRYEGRQEKFTNSCKNDHFSRQKCRSGQKCSSQTEETTEEAETTIFFRNRTGSAMKWLLLEKLSFRRME
jgi:hypothetical protein